MENHDNDILTIQDIMETLMIGRNRVYELLGSGELKGFRIGNRWKIPKRSLDEYINTKIV